MDKRLLDELSARLAGLMPAANELRHETRSKVEQVLKNLVSVLEAADFTVENLVLCTIFLVDMDDFTAVNEIYARYMPDPPPARATVEVSRLPRDVLVEADAIVLLNQD